MLCVSALGTLDTLDTLDPNEVRTFFAALKSFPFLIDEWLGYTK